MPYYNIRKLKEKHKKAVLDEFYNGVATLKNKKEVEKFFTDLLNLTEIATLSRRLIAAERLSQEETFEEISKKLKMGKDTIARVNRWLNDGEGYKLVIKRLKQNKK